ncbi:MAG: PVC-type heme-binding CxxCH protein, partial [Planctomycetota bacterium]
MPTHAMRPFVVMLLSLIPSHALRADLVDPSLFTVHPDFKLEVYATTPLFYNPTNMDFDAEGRIWVTEAVNYRMFKNAGETDPQHPEGDRVVVVEDTDSDGRADTSHVFVQDKDLVAPLGIAVIGNKIFVASAPHMILYTDVNNNRVFDEGTDTKEIFLTGFGGHDHDHSLHSITVGPEGDYYFNTGNAGSSTVTDKAGWTLRIGSTYTGGTPYNKENIPGRKSDDGHVWVGGTAMRIKPDGTGLRPIGHNFRNSYEQCVTSFGDVFQNDNDDPPASRTTWLMEGGNLGFASADGSRTWRADQRPGQDIPTAEWRQEDPGTIPAGDVYGNGAPTGIVYYENGSLPAKYRGMLLSCESTQGAVFGYLPRPTGAGFSLERFNLVDVLGGAAYDRSKRGEMGDDNRKWFRPADVAVGPDGAIYIADWYDPGVGGHNMQDPTASGAIYRVTHKDTTSLSIPEFNLKTMAGQIEGLKNPAPNVRALAFYALRDQGAKVIDDVTPLLADENPYIQARAIYLLAQLGPRGVKLVEKQLDHANPQHRIAAFRALRAIKSNVLAHAAKLSTDPAPGPRREAALAMRDVPLAKSKSILMNVATRINPKARWQVEALGLGATNKEPELYDALNDAIGGLSTQWSDRFAALAWRLHPDQSAEALFTRAAAKTLSLEQRKRAQTALAFIPTRDAGRLMVKLAHETDGEINDMARWWVLNRHTNDWREFGLASLLPPKNLEEQIARIPAPRFKGVNVPADRLAFSTPPLQNQTEAFKIDVNIEGAKRLFLVANDHADKFNMYEMASWIDPTLHTADGKQIRLTDITPTTSINAGSQAMPGFNTNPLGAKLSVGNIRAKFGLGVTAPSLLSYNIAGRNFVRFTAKVGLDKNRFSQVKDKPTREGHILKTSVAIQVYHDGPTETERLQANMQKTLASGDHEQRDAAIAQLAADELGGKALIALAAEGKLDDELTKLIAAQIYNNPSPEVRTLATNFFPILTATGEALPAISQIAAMPADAERGRELYFGRAACFTCHTFGAQGVAIGPDLTAIATKFDASVMLDSMVNPSAAIVFGYEANLITTRDNQQLTGFVVGEGDPVLLKDLTGKQHAIDKSNIVSR